MANLNKWFTNKALRELGSVNLRGLERFGEILVDEINRDASGSIPEHTTVEMRLRGIAVVNDHEAAAFVEYGTPAHEIRPKNKRVLKWEDDGGPVFARRVWHPGTAPNPFFRNGIERARARASEAWR